MVFRHFWLERLLESLRKRSVLWVHGVRRAGKTVLCQSIPDAEYFDCELPRVRRLLEDPEDFLEGLRGKRIVLDEVHRLSNPSQVLKIAADHFPGVKVVATGSSTLGASAKFKDTLAGRKAELWLTPMNRADLEAFGNEDLRHRFLHGGLPAFFLAKDIPESDFQEWVDAYWAKDIQELFRLERRHAFQKLLELLMAQSGGIFEATRFARPCEVSRATISNYLKVLEATSVVHVLRPFGSHGPAEIISAPKVYGFDTGFVCYHKGWNELRREDLGLLWEHFVLNELHAFLRPGDIHYWRDKRGHEVDLVIAPRGRPTVAIECKWSAGDFDHAGFRAFRSRYPGGENFVVCHDAERPFRRSLAGISFEFVNLKALVKALVPRR
jgi:predicted AAA+ superfamily ATPase